MINSKYETYSNERKRLQSIGKAPEWLSTAGYQLLVDKHYLQEGETPDDMYTRIAKRAAELTPSSVDPKDFGGDDWFTLFYEDMTKGWLSPSTPILTNMGTDRGHPVSCSGSTVEDSIRGFYTTRREIAQLTQRGYGTSVCLDSIRGRGAPISKGGTATGVTQMLEGVVEDMEFVSQGNTRRGSCGQYINVLHPDFDEVCDRLLTDNEGLNIGWIITDEFEALFKSNPERADHIWKKILRTKMITGKGYFFFKDKVNRARPQMYKDRGFTVDFSQLCNEIRLMADKDHSFTCILASLNADKYNEWKDTKLAQRAMVFLDAVIEDMLIKAKQEEGFERIIAFTEKSRAVGLGVLGEATYFQQEGWAFGDFQSKTFNKYLFKYLNEETLKASQYLAEHVGEPEWMKGYGERFSHRMAVAPTMSTSIIQGGVSLGIEPVFANVYVHDTAGGSVFRINPPFLKLMKERGMYTEEVMNRIVDNDGSVQEEDWLTDNEKLVFRTAFEVSQDIILDFAADRQPYIDQGQSLNLFIDNETTEEEISRLHDKAFKNEQIHGLYYIRSLNGAAKHKAATDECLACEG